MSIKSRIKGALKFIKGMLPGQHGRSAVNLGKWRPAIKGEIGHEQRRWISTSAKTVTEETPFLSRRQVLQIKGGKRLEKLAVERRENKTEAERNMFSFKRRETADKKSQYKGEPIKDIRWFERFKAERREDLEKETRDRSSDEDYARAKEFGEKHTDLDKDFMKYITSPRKKRSTRRKTDAKGRNVQDMRRRARPVHRTGSKKAA
jgi:hypothetical protein